MSDDRMRVQKLLVQTLNAADLAVDEVGDGKLMSMLSGQWKRTIPVLFHVDEQNLKVTSLLAGAPDEGHGEVYAILLHRNERSGLVHFALDDEGDIVLTGSVPLVAVDDRLLDQLLGAVLSLSDEVFNQVLRAGFASYVDREAEWRERRGMPPNPVAQGK